MTQHIHLTEASRLTGKATSTIVRAAKAGKLSAGQDAMGRAIYDPAELQRVYGLVAPPDGKRSAAQALQSPPTQEALQRVYDQRIEGLEREVRRLEGTVEDVKAERDHWRHQATALLTDQRTKEPETPAPAPAQRGLLAWLLRR